MDTGACYRVRKRAEVIFRERNRPSVEEEKKLLDSHQKEMFELLGCELTDKIDVKGVMEKGKEEIKAENGAVSTNEPKR